MNTGYTLRSPRRHAEDLRTLLANGTKGRAKALLLVNVPIVRHRYRSEHMDTTTLLIIVVLVVLLGGGGWYGRGRWY